MATKHKEKEKVAMRNLNLSEATTATAVKLEELQVFVKKEVTYIRVGFEKGSSLTVFYGNEGSIESVESDMYKTKNKLLYSLESETWQSILESNEENFEEAISMIRKIRAAVNFEKDKDNLL